MTPTVGLIFILIEWPPRACLASHALSDVPRVSADKRGKHEAESGARAGARSAQLVDYADVRPPTTTWALPILTWCLCLYKPGSHTQPPLPAGSASLILTDPAVPGKTFLTTMSPGLWFILRGLAQPPSHLPFFTIPFPHVFYFSGELDLRWFIIYPDWP